MSTNEIFNQMLSAYDLTTEQKKRNATRGQPADNPGRTL